MSYATLADLTARFGSTELMQRTDRVNMPPSTIDEDVVGKALNDAFNEINGYISVRYSLPLPATPERLVKVECDIARFFLHGEVAGENIRAAYKDAVRWLESVSKGLAQLDLPTGADAPAAIGGPQTSRPPRYFDPSEMGGF